MFVLGLGFFKLFFSGGGLGWYFDGFVWVGFGGFGVCFFFKKKQS